MRRGKKSYDNEKGSSGEVFSSGDASLVLLGSVELFLLKFFEW